MPQPRALGLPLKPRQRFRPTVTPRQGMEPTGDIASVTVPTQWHSTPSYDSLIVDPTTGGVTLPWYEFFTWLAARAAFVNTNSNKIDSIDMDVTTIQGNITTLQGQVSTLNVQVGTLQGQVGVLQISVSDLQGRMTTAEATLASLQSQIDTINSRLLAAGIP